MVGFAVPQMSLITDDSGGDALLADLLLAPGKHTVEATTAANEGTGAYRVRVQGDFAARAADQLEHIDAPPAGQAVTRTWGYLPAAATVTV